jgi:hypothetical protein
MQKSKIGWRVWVTLIVLVVMWGITSLSRTADTLVDSKLAVAQVQSSDAAYAAQQSKPPIETMTKLAGIVAILFIWGSLIIGKRPAPARCAASIVLFGALAMFGTGCGPAPTDQYEEVASDETAFVIPLQGNNVAEQSKFNSAE